jgi:hypothetical protein
VPIAWPTDDDSCDEENLVIGQCANFSAALNHTFWQHCWCALSTTCATDQLTNPAISPAVSAMPMVVWLVELNFLTF